MILIEGAIAIKAAIKANKRSIDKVYIDSKKKTKDFNYLRFLMHDKKIIFEETSRTYIDKMASGKSHGGIIATCKPRLYDDIETLKGDIFLLDGIEDPFNLGYMFRTLYAFGINAIILPKRDFRNFESQILKSSAGAFDYLNIYLSDNLENDIKTLKDRNYKAYALYRGSEAKDIFAYSFDISGKNLFLLGGEKRGIKASILKLMDEYLYIPYANSFHNALNAASACAVVATLIFSKRNDNA